MFHERGKKIVDVVRRKKLSILCSKEIDDVVRTEEKIVNVSQGGKKYCRCSAEMEKESLRIRRFAQGKRL